MDPLILGLRFVVPLLIFRFPLFGGLLSIWLDGLDWHFNSKGEMPVYYVYLDKALDFYYLSIEAFVVSTWKQAGAKVVGLFLYFFRSIGMFLFVLTSFRPLLFFFPNIFELFFIFYVGSRFLLKKEPRLTKRKLAIILVILSVPKILQEYMIHVAQVWQWRYVDLSFIAKGIQLDLILFHLLVLACVILAVCKSTFKRIRK